MAKNFDPKAFIQKHKKVDVAEEAISEPISFKPEEFIAKHKEVPVEDPKQEPLDIGGSIIEGGKQLAGQFKAGGDVLLKGTESARAVGPAIYEYAKQYMNESGEQRPFGEIYKDMYSAIEMGREESEKKLGPIATFAWDALRMGGTAAATGGFGTPMGYAAGALSGLEHTPVLEPGKAATELAIGGGLDIATAGLSKLGKAAIRDVDLYLLHDIGAKSKDFIKDRGEFGNFFDVSDVYQKHGILSPKVSGNPNAADMYDKAKRTLDLLQSNLKETIEPIKNKAISKSALIRTIKAEGLDKVSGKYAGKAGRDAREVLKKIKEETIKDIKELPDIVNIEDVFNLKQRNQYTARQLFENAKGGLSKEGDDIGRKGYAKFADKFKKVYLELAGEKASKISEIDFDSHNILNGLDRLAEQKGVERAATLGEHIPFIGGSPEAKATQAGKGLLSVIPARSIVGLKQRTDVLTGLPGAEAATKATGRAFGRGITEDQQVGRSPQSIPEQLVNQPLQRDSDFLKQNEKFVMAKIAQTNPDAFEVVQNAYDNNPDQLDDLFSGLSKMMPELFTPDKYDRFNGVVAVDKVPMARQDLLMDRDLDPSQFTAVMDELNRTGKMEYDPRK